MKASTSNCGSPIDLRLASGPSVASGASAAPNARMADPWHASLDLGAERESAQRTSLHRAERESAQRAHARETPRCTATTSSGSPCRTRPLKGQDRCAHHPQGGQRRSGRRSLIGEVGERLVATLRAGAVAEQAARSVGLHPATYHRWIEAGEADDSAGVDSDLARFYRDATRAKADARVAAVAYVRQAMSSDWRAAAWYLERTDPQEWGRRNRLTLQHRGEVSSRLDLSALTDAELAVLDDLVSKATDDPSGGLRRR